MFIAQELRKKNIAEYLLYMWQVEDTIRAFGCSLGRIRREYIDRFDYTEEQKEEETDWYGNLIRMMNEEGCREKGHIQINKVVLQQLEELHVQFLYIHFGLLETIQPLVLFGEFSFDSKPVQFPRFLEEFRRKLGEDQLLTHLFLQHFFYESIHRFLLTPCAPFDPFQQAVL